MRSLSFELGEWRVDPDTNEMARGGVVVRIEPKAMDVLVVLARHEETSSLATSCLRPCGRV